MNQLLWTLQILLAMHTFAGALWKWKNSETTMASLGAIPHGVWLGMSGLELIAAVALVAPAINRRWAIAAPAAAIFVAVEMLFLSGVHLASGSPNVGPVIYWLVVAAIATTIAGGRLLHKPMRRREFA